jgi:hypothetical protein
VLVILSNSIVGIAALIEAMLGNTKVFR